MPSLWKPKRPVWSRRATVIALVSTVGFVAAAWWSPWRPGRPGGLVFGTLAALLYLNAALYPLRRRWLAWPLGNAQRWLQLHIYGSALATWFVLLHVGFRLPAGQLGWWLWTLTMWTAVSGLAGVAIQKWVPATLARAVKVEAIYERMPELVSRLCAEADRVVEGAPAMLADAYVAKVRPMLSSLSPRWAYLSGLQAERSDALTALTSVREYLGASERERLVKLEALVREKLELDVHATGQRLLRAWLVVHVPPALLLMGLLAVHVFAVLML